MARDTDIGLLQHVYGQCAVLPHHDPEQEGSSREGDALHRHLGDHQTGDASAGCPHVHQLRPVLGVVVATQAPAHQQIHPGAARKVDFRTRWLQQLQVCSRV